MKSEFSSPTQKQESSPEGKLELDYNTQMINNQSHSRHPELDSRHSVLDTESKYPIRDSVRLKMERSECHFQYEKLLSLHAGEIE